ncbi:MAG: ABC-2 transporter permease [Oscillospiraceae bacterium]|nr:ABC-2 transporter permease [Oscillospiraceae bacterium]
MKNLLIKDLRLATLPLSWFFLAASLLTLVPGYPILLGAFFLSLGLFQTFLNAREVNDVLYTALLPVKKSDVVAARYVLVCFFQLLAFALSAALTVVRMTVLSGSQVYIDNKLMNASPVFLGFLLLIFTAFNVIFVGGFFRSAYKIGIPFLFFGIAATVLVFAGEALHFIPGMAYLNAPAGERLGGQLLFLLACVVVYAAATFFSCRASQKCFEKIDL